MNLKIVLPAIAGLSLSLFAFKPIPAESITRLENGNSKLQSINLNSTDPKELNDLANSFKNSRKSIYKFKRFETIKVADHETSQINNILAKY